MPMIRGSTPTAAEVQEDPSSGFNLCFSTATSEAMSMVRCAVVEPGGVPAVAVPPSFSGLKAGRSR